MCAHQMVTITHPKQKQPPSNTTPTRCDSLLNKKGKCYINITATEGSQPRILQYVPVLANSGVADNGGLRKLGMHRRRSTRVRPLARSGGRHLRSKGWIGSQQRGCAQARGAGEKVRRPRAAVEIGECMWDRGPKRSSKADRLLPRLSGYMESPPL